MAEARTQPLVTAAPPSAARTPPGGIQSSAISLVTVRRQALTPDRIQLFGQQKARSASCTDPRHQAGEQPAVQTGDDLPDDGAGAFQPDRREASRSGSGAAARLCGRCSVGVTALAARRHGADQDAKTRTTWNATSAWSLTPSRFKLRGRQQGPGRRLPGFGWVCCRGGALSRGWWRAGCVCAGGWGVVVFVGDGGRHRWRRHRVGEGWFDRRTAEIAADRG